MVKILAKGLRKIHGLDITGCPFNQTLDVKIQIAKYNVVNGLAVRSLKTNLKSEKWSKLFLDYYGMDSIDYSKIEFYILLDELF